MVESGGGYDDTTHNLRIWALIQAELVRVEGMKAENIERDRNGHALAYDDAAFNNVATEIERLSKLIDC